jgi:hypothetical protein
MSKTSYNQEWFSILKTVTFSNSSGTVPVFTVTGDVIVKMYIVCKTDLTSAAAANVRLGISTDTDAFIMDTVATNIDAGEVWSNITPADRAVNLTSGGELGFIVTTGEDINLTLSAQVDAGVIAFYCSYKPLSSDGLVIAA